MTVHGPDQQPEGLGAVPCPNCGAVGGLRIQPRMKIQERPASLAGNQLKFAGNVVLFLVCDECDYAEQGK